MRRRDILTGASAALLARHAGAQPVPPGGHAGAVQTLGPGPLPAANQGGLPGPSLRLDFMTPGALDPRISFSRASSATYFDSAGVLQTAGNNAPRWDYVNGVLRGVLIEEARTNYCTNSRMVGAVAGTPGTDPTGWNLAAGLGLAKQIVATGTINGMAYVDVRYFGTATGGNFFPTTPGNGGATTPGTNWTVSCYHALVAGSLTNVPALYVAANYDVTNNVALDIRPSLTSTLTRFTATSAAGASVTSISSLFWNIVITAGPVDFTLRTAAPQLEQGGFATSLIQTTSAAVTRAVDLCSMPTNPSWYVTSPYSLLFEWYADYVGSVTGGISDGVFANAAYFGGQYWNYDGAIAYNTLNEPIILNAVNKQCGTLSNAAMSIKMAWNGKVGPPVAMTTTPAPVAPSLVIGSAPWDIGSSVVNAHIRHVEYWKRVLSDAELQIRTTL